MSFTYFFSSTCRNLADLDVFSKSDPSESKINDFYFHS